MPEPTRAKASDPEAPAEAPVAASERPEPVQPAASAYEAQRPFCAHYETQLLRFETGDVVGADVGTALREKGCPLRPIR